MRPLTLTLSAFGPYAGKNKNLRKGGTDRRRRKLCFIYKWKEIFFINETGKTYQIRRRCLHRDSIRLI